MLLDATTKSLEVLLGGSPAANQLVLTTFYIDHTATSATPGSSDGLTNGATAVTMVAAPTASTQRQVKGFYIFNNDTAAATVIIRLNNNGTYRIIAKMTIQPGETIEYKQETGFKVLDIYGLLKQGGSFVRFAPLVKNMVQDAANLTAVTVFTTGTCHCYYMGPAPFAPATINLLANVTTALVTITWAEIAIYTGTPTINGNCPDLTRKGYLDVAAIYNSTGRKNNAIPVSGINAGDHIWVVMGAQATTMFQARGALADDIQSGMFQTLIQRPSTYPGPGAGTLASAAVVPAWIAIRYN
jgi:hypothetical protein